ncbi:MAG: alpha/beta hydrolase [Acidobacteriaceae bacterium]|nr:alpha/beta hydrolase [Acidobacteriaceae bacterium]
MSSLFASAQSIPNIEYGEAGGVSLRLDAHLPEGPGPFPAAIIVHGGGWVAGDRVRNVQPLFQPLEKAGFAWFSISYRLVNDAPGLGSLLLMGHAVDDVRTAVKFVKEHALDYRIDPNRVVLIGESAGAQLATMAALKPGMAGPVKAVVAFYSPSDLSKLADQSPQIPDSVRKSLKDSPWAQMIMTGLLEMSPVNFVRQDMPPLLLIHGTSDSLVPYSQSQEMCARAREAGATCDLFPVRGGGHGLRNWEPRLTSYKPYMIHWLERQVALQASRTEFRPAAHS